MANHPDCGVYRTTQALESIPAGKLVYFHNHGNPGPGIYLPKKWTANRAEWNENGNTVPSADWSSTLEPLAAEGFYSVEAEFHCCDKLCMRFEPGQLVQLGYDGDATPILFLPEIGKAGFAVPARGMRIDRTRIGKLRLLKVAVSNDAPSAVH